MTRIFSDTSTMYNIAQGKELGVEICPLAVAIKGETYLEYEEISSQDFCNIVLEGNVPTSSQPPVGNVVDRFEAYPNDEILNISMTGALSGTYNGAVAAKDAAKNCDNITVIDSKTLCGPHRYMVQVAVKMAKEGATVSEIVAALRPRIETTVSYLIPQDFDFLRRGGRLSPAAATFGALAKLVPVMHFDSTMDTIARAGTKRNMEKALQQIFSHLKASGFDNRYKLFISHAFDPASAQLAGKIAETYFPDVDMETFILSPAFITQGGPRCVAIQTVLK